MPGETMIVFRLLGIIVRDHSNALGGSGKLVTLPLLGKRCDPPSSFVCGKVRHHVKYLRSLWRMIVSSLAVRIRLPASAGRAGLYRRPDAAGYYL